MDSYESEKPINNEKDAKYKELFEKYKNANDMISDEDLNELLNEYGRKITLEKLSELIKKITGSPDISEITFDQFVQLMESEKINILNIKQNNEISNSKLYFLIILLLFTGAINVVGTKLLVSGESLNVGFQGHEKFITFSMFWGELLCLLFHYINERFLKDKKNSKSLIKEEEKKERKEPKSWYFLLPAILDILGTTISVIGLSFISSSIFQMFKGALVIFVCIATIIFIKIKYYRHHFLGIVIVILGLLIVGLNAILENKSSFGKNPALGIFLVLLSQIFACIQYIIEEKILKTYKIAELKAVGLEGIWGGIIYIILLFIFYFIDCKNWPDYLKKSMCAKDNKGNTRLEDTIFAFKQIVEEKKLLFYLLLVIFSIAFFNFSGLAVAKYGSSTLRTIVNIMRTVIIWAFFLIMPFVPEETKEEFSWLQLLGFIIVLLGGAIYNEILVIPFCKFADYTKEGIKKRELLEKQISGLNKGLINENNDKD